MAAEHPEQLDQLIGTPELVNSIPDAEPTTPLERAQDLISSAFEASGAKRVHLAREALISPDCADAILANPYVPAYLTGERPVPASLPPYYSPGQDSEAVWYAQEQKSVWDQTPGTTDWVQEAMGRIISLLVHSNEAVLRCRMPGGAGPNFFLNTSVNARYTKRPECDELMMKTRVRYLTLPTKPNVIMVTRQQCRYCPHDDLLIAQADNLQPALALGLTGTHPEFIGNDHIVVGDIPANAMRRRAAGSLDPDEIKEQTVTFREQRRYPEPFWGWYFAGDPLMSWTEEDDDEGDEFDVAALDAGLQSVPELPYGGKQDPTS